MAYYAKISNDEFTVSERSRLAAAEQERYSIIATNTDRENAEYTALKDAYRESLNGTEEEQKIAKDNLEAKESEGTEALTIEIEALETKIANALCRVTDMCSGVDEYTSSKGEETAEDNSVYWEGYYGGCKRTSYNTRGGAHTLGGTPFRKNYAGVGYIYDPVRDAFYSQQPYASWTLNESTCYWSAPTSIPEEGDWYWKEDTTEWVDYVYINPDNNQPYPSWIWDITNGGWKAPIEAPAEYYRPAWDEKNQRWIDYETGNYYWKEDTREYVDYVYYNPDNNQPYPSWTWDSSKGIWEPPVEKPDDDLKYYWNEETLTWEKTHHGTN